MVSRRQLLSYDDWVHKPFYHQTSPRKWRSYDYSKNVPDYTPSLLYTGSCGWARDGEHTCGRAGIMRAANDAPGYWIGKKLIYWQGESLDSFVQQVRLMKFSKENAISEFEIAQFARPNTYRIIFVDNAGIWRSKPDTTYRAGRLNLFIGPDDRIRGVGYF